MVKLTKICNPSDKFPIESNDKTWTCYGTNAPHFRSYVMFLGRSEMSILINNWIRYQMIRKKAYGQTLRY